MLYIFRISMKNALIWYMTWWGYWWKNRTYPCL